MEKNRLKKENEKINNNSIDQLDRYVISNQFHIRRYYILSLSLLLDTPPA